MDTNPARLDLTIQDVGFGGDGVGRTPEGQAVFVPFTMTGERVRVRVEANQGRFARAVLEEVLESSPQRTAPACPHFGRCGGCAYQHLEYPAEVACKRAQLTELLGRLGGLEAVPELEAVVPSERDCGYRNKLRVEPIVSRDANDEQAVAYGYYERDNTTVFALDACPLAATPLNHFLTRAPSTPEGRRNAGRDKPMPLTLRLTAEGSTGFYFGRAPKRVPWLHESLLGRPVSVPLGSFWQVNPGVAEALVQRVSSWFAAAPTRTLIDAYSGVGTFSLAIGPAAHTRFLIESDEQALQAAQYNHAQWDGLECRCRLGRTEAVLPRLLADANRKRTTVLLDPPRQGCGEGVIRSLCEFAVGQVLYVSCNPATLARDLGRLVRDGGYVLRRLALFDMFPRTAHFETAVLLDRA